MAAAWSIFFTAARTSSVLFSALVLMATLAFLIAVFSALKTAIKKANVAISTNAENKTELVRAAVKKIDQAAAKNLIHKNCAARKKSSLAAKLNKAQ